MTSIAELAWLVTGQAHAECAMEQDKLARDATAQCANIAMVRADVGVAAALAGLLSKKSAASCAIAEAAGFQIEICYKDAFYEEGKLHF